MSQDQEGADRRAGATVGDRLYPKAVRSLESTLLEERRRAAGIDPGVPKHDAVGVGISGGGIRSATFALGLFQAMAHADIVRRFDYVSTVSGGGYFGAFLGALYARIHRIITKDGLPPSASLTEHEQTISPSDLVRAVLRDSSHPVVDHLRQNGQYLAPASSDRILFGAVLLRNWLALMLVVGLGLLTASLGFEVLWIPIQSVIRSSTSPGSLLRIWVEAPVIASPWLLLAALALVVAIPIGWAYWILDQVTWWTALLGALFGALVASELARQRGLPGEIVWLVRGTGGLALLLAVALMLAAPRGDPQQKLNGDSRARHTASNWLKTVLVFLGICLALAATDSAGRFVYQYFTRDSWTFGTILAAAWTFLLSVVPFASKIMALFGRAQKRARPPAQITGIVTFVATIVLFLCVATASTFTQILARDASEKRTLFYFPPESFMPAASSFGCFLFLSLLIGWTHSLLNRSTQLPLYSARITRAYLGASNPNRHREPIEKGSKPHPSAATRLRDDDDIPAIDYFGWKRNGTSTAWKNGGPLHIINATLNETIDGRTKAHELDRKGLGLAIGPHGLSLGARHHLTFEESSASEPPPGGFSVFRASSAKVPESEMLSLGLWASISGAAFSTGLGSRTRPAFSFLAGMTNVRLGYWWFAPWTRFSRPKALFQLLWVQRYLVRELGARFAGTANPLWYLSDGGHFENMGAYELIRRRLPFMLVIDGEADPDYTFEGLANLVRKARLDFGAEIEFLEEPERELRLEPGSPCPLGPLRSLKPDGNERNSPKQASLARVTYAHGDNGAASEGYLLYVKATLFPSIPADLREYADKHISFPQETTIDQFFDEAQWESYRKLGELIGKLLFDQQTLVEKLFRGPPVRQS